MPEAFKQRIGPGLLTAYGVGVMVGAGIYVLIGAVVGQAGIWSPLGFLLAGLIAAPTALSYAEFSTRIPEAAGEAAYVGVGFNSQVLALIVGLAIVAAGTVSAGAVLRGGVGYLNVFWGGQTLWLVIGMGVILTGVALYGALESLALVAVFTVIELAGLGLVIWAGFNAPPVADWQVLPSPQWSGIGLAAVLAFFAFIGFEDIVNMAEEVDRPQSTLPKAILMALAITTFTYILVATAAVRAVPAGELAMSKTPLVLVWQAGRGGSGNFLSAIAVFAALNGVLAQIVMASRVLYGLGRRSPSLAVFHHVHPTRGTPVLATCLIGAAVIIMALLVNLVTLAGATSSILLMVFVLVNLALILLKRRAPEAAFKVPMVVPVLGFILSLAALIAGFRGMI